MITPTLHIAHPTKRPSRKGAWVLLVLLLGIWGTVQSQTPAHYGQYLFNGLVLNPAYAGSRDALNITGMYRNQWVSFPGAPKTATVSAHSPLRNTHNNFGGMIIHDDVGIVRQQWIMGSYAYRFEMGKQARLALGLQGGVSLHQFRYGDLFLAQPGDLTFQGNTPVFPIPRFGAGAYFDHPKFFLGFSVPEMFRYRNQNYEQHMQNSVDYPHFFLTGGTLFSMGPGIKLKPSVLIKYKQSIPLQADLKLNLIYRDKIWLGASYRTDDAIVGLFQYLPVPQLRIGYAYEYGIHNLGAWNFGTHELMISYELGYGVKTRGTRYF